jgi:hypothetical protein
MPFDPLIGRSNPELKRIAPTQKYLLALAASGAAVLIGLLFFLFPA